MTVLLLSSMMGQYNLQRLSRHATDAEKIAAMEADNAYWQAYEERYYRKHPDHLAEGFKHLYEEEDSSTGGSYAGGWLLVGLVGLVAIVRLKKKGNE